MDTEPDKCPEKVWAPGAYTWHRCGRKIKAEGLCGIHLNRKHREEKSFYKAGGMK